MATTYEELIGEELVDASNVYAFADRMYAEADRLWASDTHGWHVLSQSPVLNETIAVGGVFAGARVNVERAAVAIDAPAQLVFDFLVSPHGYKVIDPFSDPKDHEKPPLETFDASKWRDGDGDGDGPKRLEVTSAVAKIPFMATREFVVLNAIDANARYFVSKSIQHRSVPGASAWTASADVEETDVNDKNKKKRTVRALSTFAVRVEPADGKDGAAKCVVRFINYANLAGRFSPTIQNRFNKTFLPAVAGRLKKAVEKKKQKKHTAMPN